jgi:hypothetical protein
MQAATRSERRTNLRSVPGLETILRKPTRRQSGEGRCPAGSERHSHRGVPPGYLTVACMTSGNQRQHGKPCQWRRVTANGCSARNRIRLVEVAERPVVVTTPGNAGRAKGPWFKGQRHKRHDSREIDNASGNSAEGWEIADGAAH